MRLTLTLALVFLITSAIRADDFDNYTNAILAKVGAAADAQAVRKLSPAGMIERFRVLPGVNACFVVVKTNEGRWAKVLIQPGKQKMGDGAPLPIVFIDRFVTYREGEEKAVLVQGASLRLFDGFRFSLDMGQVVPEKVAADLRAVVDNGECFLEAVGKAEVYVPAKNLIEAAPKKGEKLTVGATFDPAYFNGDYKLYDDGRRSGTLHLKTLPLGEIEGVYYSDKDGRKYEVAGRLDNPNHKIEFTITYPQSVQSFTGWLFTGDAQAITGTSRLQDRETGFYALRMEK